MNYIHSPLAEQNFQMECSNQCNGQLSPQNCFEDNKKSCKTSIVFQEINSPLTLSSMKQNKENICLRASMQSDVVTNINNNKESLTQQKCMQSPQQSQILQVQSHSQVNQQQSNSQKKQIQQQSATSQLRDSNGFSYQHNKKKIFDNNVNVGKSESNIISQFDLLEQSNSEIQLSARVSPLDNSQLIQKANAIERLNKQTKNSEINTDRNSQIQSVQSNYVPQNQSDNSFYKDFFDYDMFDEEQQQSTAQSNPISKQQQPTSYQQNKPNTQIINTQQQQQENSQLQQQACIVNQQQLQKFQQKMLELIGENEKLISYNEALMKENEILKQSKEALETTHKQEIDNIRQSNELMMNELKRKYEIEKEIQIKNVIEFDSNNNQQQMTTLKTESDLTKKHIQELEWQVTKLMDENSKLNKQIEQYQYINNQTSTIESATIAFGSQVCSLHTSNFIPNNQTRPKKPIFDQVQNNEELQRQIEEKNQKIAQLQEDLARQLIPVHPNQNSNSANNSARKGKTEICDNCIKFKNNLSQLQSDFNSTKQSNQSLIQQLESTLAEKNQLFRELQTYKQNAKQQQSNNNFNSASKSVSNQAETKSNEKLRSSSQKQKNNLASADVNSEQHQQEKEEERKTVTNTNNISTHTGFERSESQGQLLQSQSSSFFRYTTQQKIELEQKLAYLIEENRILNQTLAKRLDEIENLKNKCSGKCMSEANQKINDLTNQFYQEKKYLQEQLDQLQIEKENWMEEQNQFSKKKQEYQENMESTQQQIMQLENNLNNTLEDLQKQSVNNQQIPELIKENEQLTSRISTIQAEHNHVCELWKGEIDNLMSKIHFAEQAHKEEVNQIQEEMDRQKVELEKHYLSSFEQDRNNYGTTINEMEKEQRQLIEKIDQLQIEKQQIQIEYENEIVKYQQNQERVRMHFESQLDNEFNEHQVQIKKFKETFRDCEQQISKNQMEIEGLRRENKRIKEKLEEELISRQQIIQDYERKYQAYQNNCEYQIGLAKREGLQEINRLQLEIEQLKRIIQERQDLIQRLENSNTNVQRYNNNYQYLQGQGNGQDYANFLQRNQQNNPSEQFLLDQFGIQQQSKQQYIPQGYIGQDNQKRNTNQYIQQQQQQIPVKEISTYGQINSNNRSGIPLEMNSNMYRFDQEQQSKRTGSCRSVERQTSNPQRQSVRPPSNARQGTPNHDQQSTKNQTKSIELKSVLNEINQNNKQNQDFLEKCREIVEGKYTNSNKNQ